MNRTERNKPVKTVFAVFDGSDVLVAVFEDEKTALKVKSIYPGGAYVSVPLVSSGCEDWMKEEIKNSEMIREGVFLVVKEFFHRETVNPEDDLVNDYDMDSLDIIDFIMRLENKFDIDITNKDIDMYDLQTVNDIVEMVKHKLHR